MRRLRSPLLAAALFAATLVPGAALADGPVVTNSGPLAQLRHDSLRVRRRIGAWVLGGGAFSTGAGAGLLATGELDQALRVAGAVTLAGGVVNGAVGGHALHGIARERRRLEDPATRAAWETPAGLQRALRDAIEDEQREALGHAVNLGLDVGYAGIAGAAILASQLGADHADRWLGAGVAIAVQAAYIIGLNIGGLVHARRFHRSLLSEQARLAPR